MIPRNALWTRVPKSGSRRKQELNVQIVDTTSAGYKVIQFERRYRTIERIVHPRTLS